jgi:hypothetical protein
MARVGPRIDTTRLGLDPPRGISGPARKPQIVVPARRGRSSWAWGGCARACFDAVGAVMPDGLAFAGRFWQPPLGVVNAALPYGCVALAGEAASALCAAGVGMAIGLLHADAGCRASLALEVMEEFRPRIVDQRPQPGGELDGPVVALIVVVACDVSEGWRRARVAVARQRQGGRVQRSVFVGVARPRSARSVDRTGGGDHRHRLDLHLRPLRRLVERCPGARASQHGTTSPASGRCCDPKRSARRQFGRQAIMLWAPHLCMCPDQPKDATKPGCPQARPPCDAWPVQRTAIVAGHSGIPGGSGSQDGHAKRRIELFADAIVNYRNSCERACRGMPTGGVAEVVPDDLGEEHRPDSGGSRTWVTRGFRPQGRDVVGMAGGGALGAQGARAGQPLSLTGRQPVFASPQFSRRLSRPAWKHSHHAVVGDRRCPHRRARPTPAPRFPQPIQQAIHNRIPTAFPSRPTPLK